ncbi:MAG: calcium-binding protein [Pseudomonadota bacterium]
MPNFIISTHESTGQSLSAGEVGVVTQDGSITNTAAISAINAFATTGNINILVNGGVIGAGGFFSNGIDMDTETGKIFIGQSGYVTSTGGNGITVDFDTLVSVSNDGTISGDSRGIFARVSDDAGFFRVVNTGTVNALREGVVVDTGTGNGTIINSGTITSSINGIRIGLFNDNTGSAFTISNSGRIEAPTRAIIGSEEDMTLLNTGSILGDILLDAGNDIYRGASGRLEGFIDAGAGDDLVIAGSDNDTLLGQNGIDELRGGAGDDTLRGGNDDDTLLGQAGDDFLAGGGGDDKLLDGAGDDRLSGFGGEDLLNGGRGDDGLTGGAGADIFEFFRSAGNDTIWDFQNGVDRIDLTAFNVFFSDINAAVTNRWGNAVIDLDALGGSGSILIMGAAGQLDASDFIL